MTNVLIVDDSKFVANAMRSILESMHFDVVAVAYDGLEGLQKYCDHWPDLTLLDITMPNMDGLECLCKIREMNASARVVMLSAVKDQHTIDGCLNSGAASFLQKPIRKDHQEDLDRLQQALALALGKSV
jgi:two-component system chemotaxis response regulator CheY